MLSDILSINIFVTLKLIWRCPNVKSKKKYEFYKELEKECLRHSDEVNSIDDALLLKHHSNEQEYFCLNEGISFKAHPISALDPRNTFSFYENANLTHMGGNLKEVIQKFINEEYTSLLLILKAFTLYTQQPIIFTKEIVSLISKNFKDEHDVLAWIPQRLITSEVIENRLLLKDYQSISYIDTFLRSKSMTLPMFFDCCYAAVKPDIYDFDTYITAINLSHMLKKAINKEVIIEISEIDLSLLKYIPLYLFINVDEALEIYLNVIKRMIENKIEIESTIMEISDKSLRDKIIESLLKNNTVATKHTHYFLSRYKSIHHRSYGLVKGSIVVLDDYSDKDLSKIISARNFLAHVKLRECLWVFHPYTVESYNTLLTLIHVLFHNYESTGHLDLLQCKLESNIGIHIMDHTLDKEPPPTIEFIINSILKVILPKRNSHYFDFCYDQKSIDLCGHNISIIIENFIYYLAQITYSDDNFYIIKNMSIESSSLLVYEEEIPHTRCQYQNLITKVIKTKIINHQDNRKKEFRHGDNIKDYNITRVIITLLGNGINNSTKNKIENYLVNIYDGPLKINGIIYSYNPKYEKYFIWPTIIRKALSVCLDNIQFDVNWLYGITHSSKGKEINNINILLMILYHLGFDIYEIINHCQLEYDVEQIKYLLKTFNLDEEKSEEKKE